MAFQWLQMRIGEEQDRRTREAKTLAMLPDALHDLNRQLRECVTAYQEAFGEDAADIHFHGSKIRITVREQKNGKWEPHAKVEVTSVPALPGFEIERGDDDRLLIDVGLLPGEKLFYRTGDQFLSMEEVTRRILDRALFPKLKD